MSLFFDFIANFLFSEFAGSIRIKKRSHGGFLKSTLERLKKGNIIGIFPEGIPTRSPDLRKGKTGVARLVLNAKVPVVPIGIKGTLYLWSRLKWLPRPANKVTIKIGKPMDFSKYQGKDPNYVILQKVTRNIMSNIAKLTGQKYKY
jgi:1-acyl-sn-glycerol-3-phosphate acyltransferase